MSLLISVFLFIVIYTNQQRNVANDNLNYIETLYVKHAVNMEKNKIKAAFSVMLSNYEHINDIIKPKLKRRLDMAYDIIMNIYKNNKGVSADKLVTIIKDALGPIRFDKGEGYFFIYNMRGVNIMFPPDKSTEGKNMINVKDANGEYIIKKSIEIAKTKGSGFIEWYWQKPVNYYITKNSRVFREIGYIRYVKPFDWFIGTGIYVKSELYRMENQFIKLYERKKEKNGEYFIVLRPLDNGNMKVLADSSRPFLDGNIISKHYTDENGYSYLPSLLEMIKDGKTEGMIKYRIGKKRKLDKEIILYMFYKKLNMLVSCGINMDDVESIVNTVRSQYKSRMYRYVRNTVFLTLLIIVFVGVLFLFIAQKINGIFFRYEKEVKEKEEKLEKLALYDNLTQIYNRNRFNEILKYELNMSKRYKLPLSLIMFDLDHFKKVNDKFGHATGDKVLKTIAQSVQKSIRLTDTLARWGGEEFFIILPKTDVDMAKKIAESLRAQIQDIDFKEVGDVTCSLGVTGVKKNDTENDLIKRADEAMYKAKQNGRNRVEVL